MGTLEPCVFISDAKGCLVRLDVTRRAVTKRQFLTSCPQVYKGFVLMRSQMSSSLQFCFMTFF